MTRDQLLISAIAIIIAVVNPWLVARSNRKAAARAAKAAPVRKDERMMGVVDMIGWGADICILFVAFSAIVRFVVVPMPMTRAEVAILAVFAAVMFTTLQNLGARVTLLSDQIRRLRSIKKP